MSLATQTPNTRYLGIDPGLSGGWALVAPDATLIDCGGFPTHKIKKGKALSTQLDSASLVNRLALLRFNHGADISCFVEAVGSRPRQQGQFQFGFNTGLVHGVLYSLQLPVQTVLPKAWKASYGLKRNPSQTQRDMKNEARDLATHIFPNHEDKFKRVKDDGVAEAALIALYGLYVTTEGNTK